jgi:hypothetical protein
MKHPSSRMLFAYWDSLRGDRAAPERGEIQAGALRHVLADAFVLANDDTPRFRLAGTRICTFFCQELAGAEFGRIWNHDDRAEIDGLIRLPVENSVGIVAGAIARNVNGSEVAAEMILLPLRHRGRTDARLIGALSFSTLPSWAGLVPLACLELRSLRIIEGEREPEPSSDPSPRTRRSEFVVHEGGVV